MDTRFFWLQSPATVIVVRQLQVMGQIGGQGQEVTVRLGESADISNHPCGVNPDHLRA